MAHFDDVLAGNAAFARSFTYRGLPGRAARGLAVVTCMDSRIDPLGILGLAPGGAKILRTAGARVTDDVLASLVLAHHALGVDRVLVLAHTDCGMTKKTDAQVHELIRERTGGNSDALVFDTIPDQDARLAADVRRIKDLGHLTHDMPVAGGIYDVHTGAVRLTV